MRIMSRSDIVITGNELPTVRGAFKVELRLAIGRESRRRIF